MTKTKNSLKIFVIAALAFAAVSSCESGYLDTNKINLNEYDPIIKELSVKSSAVDSLFIAPNPSTTSRFIQLKDFYLNKALIGAFPRCYNLLRENKAIEIVYFSSGCIFIILRRHEGVFKDKVECLKIGNLNNCDLSLMSQTAVEKEIHLKNGWLYQIVIFYMDT